MPAVQIFDGVKISSFHMLAPGDLVGNEYVAAIRPNSNINYLVKLSDIGGGGNGNTQVASDLPHPFLLLNDD